MPTSRKQHLLEKPRRLWPAHRAGWTLPAGVDVGDIVAGAAKTARRADGQLRAGLVLLPVALQLAPSFKAAEHLTVRLHASWLVCKLECIPEEGDFTLQLPLHGSTALHAGAFAAAQAAQLALMGDSRVRVDSGGEQLHLEACPVCQWRCAVRRCSCSLKRQRH